MTVPASNAREAGASDVATLARGLTIGLCGLTLSRILRIGALVVMARMLGAAQFGLYAIAWTLARVVSGVSPLALQNGAIYFGTLYRKTDPARFKGVLIQSILMSSLFGGLIALLVYFAADYVAVRVFSKPQVAAAIRAFAPAFAFLPAVLVASSITRISQEIEYSIYIELITHGVTLLLFVVLFALGWGLLGAVFATVAGVGASFSLALYLVWRLFIRHGPATRQAMVARQLLIYSLPITMVSLGSISVAYLDRMFVAAYGSASDMGYYQAASQLSITFATVITSFTSIFSPMVADLHHRGERERLGEMFKVSTKWAAYLGIPLFLAVAFAPLASVRLLYGRAYDASATPLVILCLGQLVALVAGGSGTVLTQTSNHVVYSKLSLIAVGADVVLNVLLVPRFGMIGAAVAGSGSIIILHGSSLLVVNRLLGIVPCDGRCRKVLFGALAAAGALAVMRVLLGTGAARDAIAAVVVSCAVFFTVIFMAGADSEDRQVINSISSRLLTIR